MPLAERDVNTQHQRPLTRGKRLQVPGAVTDENIAPSPAIARAKATPTHHQRFLASTKASVAKNAQSPATGQPRAQPLSGRNTPTSQIHGSKLPRRNLATPSPKPAYNLHVPISKWNTSIARKPIAPLKETVDHSPTPLSRGGAVDQSLIAHATLPSGTHRARDEKPLPSRPIASLAYAPSPSRDSRSLIDASERPLRLSVAGSERDWPTLIPASQSTPVLMSASSTAGIDDRPSRLARMSASAASLVPTLSHTAINEDKFDLDNHLGDAKSGSPELTRSSIASYISASETLLVSEDIEATSQHVHCQTPDVNASGSTATLHPPRKSSLADSYSNNRPIERSHSTDPKHSGSSGLAQDIFEASRPHSPSPASFSRPRPTSFSRITSIMSTPSSAVETPPTKLQKTASRIPLPDQKKATLVDIRGRRTSGIPIPKFEKGLSFGGRRIDSPDPLKVLDHGIKRRQLQRANTGGSSSTASTVPTRFLGNGTPPIDRSKANTPDSTMGSTSEEEEEITTPSDKPTHFVKHGYKPKHMNRGSGSHYAGATLKVYDEAEVVLGRPPPSNSPFTGHLQTIPSQSTLPVSAVADRDSLQADSRPKVVIKPTEFSAFAQRLSILKDSHDLFTADQRDRQSLIGGDTKSELVDILHEAEHEDALISQCGAKGLDAETKEEITSTLGMLEGRCGPASTTVDLAHLSRMFGRLKTGFEKAPKSAAFVEDATLAERFLARRASIVSNKPDTAALLGVDTTYEAPHIVHDDGDASSQLSKSKTVASKWSTSTASPKECPLPFTDTESRRSTFGMDFGDMPPALPPKYLTNSKPKSIGYPSRTPGKAHRLLGTDEQSASAHRTTARRVSSPTLGVRIPGSVRAAREKARDAAGSRVNKASTTKVEKLPTPNTRVFKFSEDPPRGRLPSGEKSAHRNSTKLPRSHSKSRYVLDKINGLFSGKRDKRNSELPPLPPVKDSFDHEKSLLAPKEVRINSMGSPMLNDARKPPITKMPTISPPVDAVHPALRSAPSSTSVAPSASTMTIGSDTDHEGRRSLQVLSEKLLGRALQEGDPAKKERLLNFAKVLNDSLISAREAQISAETAQTAAHSAQLSYEMTMKSVAMLQRLASSMNRR